MKNNRNFSTLNESFNAQKKGFTLIEVVLVMVVIVIISGIALPHFAGSFKSNKLRTTTRTISKMSRYARSMAIMREEIFTLVLNHESMEIFLGGPTQTSTNAADGELDQDVLKRLGYLDKDDAEDPSALGVQKEVHRFLPDDLSVKHFDKDWADKDRSFENFYLVRFFPNGQCEWFEMELQDKRGTAVKLEIDPISGKVRSEFIQ